MNQQDLEENTELEELSQDYLVKSTSFLKLAGGFELMRVGLNVYLEDYSDDEDLLAGGLASCMEMENLLKDDLLILNSMRQRLDRQQLEYDIAEAAHQIIEESHNNG